MRSNIYVAPNPTDANRTIITINTRYALSTRVNGQNLVEHIGGNMINRQQIPERDGQSIIFNTTKPGSVTDDSNNVTTLYVGRGRPESEILQMVR
mgnify:FL=1